MAQAWSVFAIPAVGAAAGILIAAAEVLYYNKMFVGEGQGCVKRAKDRLSLTSLEVLIERCNMQPGCCSSSGKHSVHQKSCSAPAGEWLCHPMLCKLLAIVAVNSCFAWLLHPC